MKLKDKLKKWLFQKELCDIQETKDKYDKLMQSVERANATLNKAREMHDRSQGLLSDCHKLMSSICDVGTDVGYNSADHSWAVICVHGKKDYVKFVDMRQSDIRTIVSFLKNFEYSNRVIDSPLVHRDYIENEIIRW